MEDPGLLLRQKEILIQFPDECDSYALRTYSKTDYDEAALWEENEKLKANLKKLQKKESKLSRDKKVIINQLQHSEEVRYALEGELDDVRNQCNGKKKSLDVALKELHSANYKLESMTSKWQISQHELGMHVAKMKGEKETEEFDGEMRVKQLLCSLQELQLRNIEYQNLVISHEATILKLKETIGISAASKDSKMEAAVEVSLSDEISSQDSKSTSDKDKTTKTNTHTASNEGQNLIIPTGTVLHAEVKKYSWKLLLRKELKNRLPGINKSTPKSRSRRAGFPGTSPLEIASPASHSHSDANLDPDLLKLTQELLAQKNDDEDKESEEKEDSEDDDQNKEKEETQDQIYNELKAEILLESCLDILEKTSESCTLDETPTRNEKTAKNDEKPKKNQEKEEINQKKIKNHKEKAQKNSEDISEKTEKRDDNEEYHTDAEEEDAKDPAAQFVVNFNEDKFEVDPETGDPRYTFPVPPAGDYANLEEITAVLRDVAVRHRYGIATRRSVAGKSKTWKCDR
ncbi:hypothetical protein PTTG_26859 [Puccinia triticina 1-1 BBBD Race 1]|uniref:Uncharacterized protein n=1 Tax=Puccinia triticina (isolate 1-1 / race 1 (BBBD)) TaxID=630390 RepID=A0A180GQB0_PUCT1|nr:hypothetical protein PTTG_26859 [Puccinia triticina 1-1 BBBD Race 1]